MRKNVLTPLMLPVALGLSLAGCRDTRAREENEQLKTQITALQKENADLLSRVDQLTAARDGLMRDNDALKAENQSLQAKHSLPRAPSAKRK